MLVVINTMIIFLRSLYHNVLTSRSIVEEGHFHNHRFATGRVIVGDATALLRLAAIFGINREQSPVNVENHWMLSETFLFRIQILLYYLSGLSTDISRYISAARKASSKKALFCD